VVHNMNNKFTEDKNVGMYRWLSEMSMDHTPFHGHWNGGTLG
jgi:hypothetical protein